MLPKSQRVPRSSFGPLIESRNSLHDKHFSLKYVEGLGPRVAVSVSKKVSKSAVRRNKVRRRVYSTVSKIIPGLKKGLYLVVSRPGADKLSFFELETEIRRLFSKFLIS